MIQIKFKNLEKSEIAYEIVEERIHSLIDKFSDLQKSKIHVTLEMENSPKQAGPDFFKVKIYISHGRYDGITFEKGNSNLYVALAHVTERMLEVLNRYGDKSRVRQRKKAREIEKKNQVFISDDDLKTA